MSGPGGPAPRRWDALAPCVDAVLETVGPTLVVGTPIGLGKPVPVLDELWRRALADPGIELTIVTGLTLTRPRPRGELERRLLAPVLERLFAGCVEPAWAGPRRAGRLPPNVRVLEFYLQAGALLSSPHAQRDFVSSNYSDVVRDALDRGLNVYAQMVARRGGRLSLSGNPDLTLDALFGMRAAGRPSAAVADVNPNLPFMGGDAEVEDATFDHVLDVEAHHTPLFATPSDPVSTLDWMVALHASALVRDGGTLQLGIGTISDAVCHLLRLRHEDNATWRGMLESAGVLQRWGGLIERVGGTGPFERGLYASTEMLHAGLLVLLRAGIVRRRAWPSPGLQRLADGGRLGERPDGELLAALAEHGGLSAPLSARDLELLVGTGVLDPNVRLAGETLVLGDGRRVPADLRDPDAREALASGALGERLQAGPAVHAGFFVGPRSMYEELAALDEETRELIGMTRVAWTNTLDGEEELKRAQRRDARFLNTVMIMTLFGAAVSDTLEDGRVVGGVGGQHDFVRMAHALDDGRSVLMLRSTHLDAGRPSSNVVFGYGTTTIPRQERDLVVTEYGIAELRGRTDAECAAAMIGVADARFQPDLVERARAAGKLAPEWEVPSEARHNVPERLEALVRALRRRGTLPRFPVGGGVLDEVELRLARCLRATGERLSGRRPRLPTPGQLARVAAPPDAAGPYLERMGLARPSGVRERLMRLFVLYSLVTEGALADDRAHPSPPSSWNEDQ